MASCDDDIYEIVDLEGTMKELKSWSNDKKHNLMMYMRFSTALCELHLKGLIDRCIDEKRVNDDKVREELIGLENFYEELLGNGFIVPEIELVHNNEK